jgi:hypothetical protein
MNDEKQLFFTDPQLLIKWWLLALERGVEGVDFRFEKLLEHPGVCGQLHSLPSPCH